jgi:hypothetical protein
MNKIKKVLLAILGGIDVFLVVSTPMFIYFFWILFFGFNNFSSWILLGVTVLSSMFRAIKVGWMKR